MTPAHSLRAVIEEAIDTSEVRFSLKDLTVLSPQVDPFRQDTEANHRDAEWLAEHAQSLGLLSGEKTIHLRGMHYALLGSVKPDGSQYVNDDDAWTWVNKAAKSARWLGYIPFDKIHDQKHPDPIIREFSRVNPWPYLSVGIDVDIPEVDDIDPKVGMLDFHGVQPYRLVIIGEKSSLEGVLNPVAARFGADLYLLTGNISDTLVHRIAQSGADDGRQVNVFYFSDCDPYGWNMPIEVGRKLQAFKASLYPDLEFRQYRIALTPEQVHEYHLPSTPLKSNERTARRNANWLKAFGVEQTEIDALATLQPDLLKQIAVDAIAPFYDYGLDRRVREVKNGWIEDAQQMLNAQVDGDQLERLRVEAESKLADLRTEINAINDALRIDIDKFDLPDIPDVPDPDVGEDAQPKPLVDSRWSWVEQTKALLDSKNYRRLK